MIVSDTQLVELHFARKRAHSLSTLIKTLDSILIETLDSPPPPPPSLYVSL
jgi:hypothetical protein